MSPRALFLLLMCCLMPAMQARAQLQGGNLQGGGGLGGNDERGLQTSRLQSGSLKPSSIEGSSLQRTKPQQPAERLNPSKIKLKAAELAEGGLGVEKIQGAVSSIPRTQVGELLYDVAGVLSLMEESLTEVAVGYYMAVLADPQGLRHDDALKRLMEIFLAKDLEHDRAVRLYQGGLETMKGLVDINIGLTAEGHRAGLRTLQEVSAAYHVRRAKDMPKESDAVVDGYSVPLSGLKREDVGKEAAEP